MENVRGEWLLTVSFPNTVFPAKNISHARQIMTVNHYNIVWQRYSKNRSANTVQQIEITFLLFETQAVEHRYTVGFHITETFRHMKIVSHNFKT